MNISTLQVTKYQRQITMFLCMRLINRKGTILWTVYFSENNAHIDEMEQLLRYVFQCIVKVTRIETLRVAIG
jgi:hypothetical protein